MADARAFWERTASRYDRSMLLLGAPLRAMAPLLVEEVRGLERVLELAAGTGLVTATLAPVVGRLVATDYADAMVERLQRRVRAAGLHNVRTRALDLYDLDGRERFDAVVAANVLHLVPDLPGALDAMVRSLRPGGRLIVPTYCHDETALARVVSRGLAVVGFPGERRLTLASLRARLEDRGLAVRRARRLAGLLPVGFVSAEIP